MGQHIGATIGADDQHHLSFTSGSGNQIFYTFEDEGAWSSEMVRSSMVLNEGIQIHATLDSKPYLVYRDTTALDIEIAVKNNSAWEFDSVSPDISVSGEHFSSSLLSNGTLVIAGLIHDGQTTNLTIWDWNHSITSNTTLAVIEDNQTQLSMGVSSDGTVYLATLTSGGALSLHSRNATESTWNTHALAQPPTSNGGYNLDMDVSTNLALSIGTTSTIELRTSDDGQNWTNSFHSFSTHIDAAWDLVVTDDHYIMITTHSTSGNLVWNSIHREHITSQHSTWSSMEFGLIETPSTTSAILDLNNTLHLGIWDDVNDDVEVIRIYQDTDRDHVFDAIDEFPALGNQWLDSDGDGYGDNQFGPIADGCPSEAGTSSFVIYGCIDFESDGFTDSIDGCADQKGTSWIDRYGCTDSDQDGWSDSSVSHIYGDKFIDNWKQARDSDGDGVGDNHGPDCCTVTYPWGEQLGSSISWDGDQFPYLWTQWKDTDGDGFGDNDSDSVHGDYCPWDWGASWRDRNGCLDTDNDGASDASLTGDIFEWNYSHGADLWPTMVLSGQIQMAMDMVTTIRYLPPIQIISPTLLPLQMIQMTMVIRITGQNFMSKMVHKIIVMV